MSSVPSAEELSALGGLVGLSEQELGSLSPFVRRQVFAAGEEVFALGSSSDALFAVVRGSVALTVHSQRLALLRSPALLGGFGVLDGTARRSGAVAVEEATLLAVQRSDLMSAARIPPAVALAVMAALGRSVSQILSGSFIFRDMDVLLCVDGGCSPGYDAVVAFLTEEFEARGRRVTVAATGFKSIVSGRDEDFHILIHDEQLYKMINVGPRIVYAPSLVLRRGSSFRTERFPEFSREEHQRKAAQVIAERNVKTLVCIGGNGTLAGAKSLSRFLPSHVQCFFIPCSIDSDVGGTETIGQHTAVEMGAEKLRCYIADGLTHHRAYFIEMMGRDGGHHTLYSALGAGAALALMPHSKPNLSMLAEAVTNRTSTVVAVSEGYCRHQRAEEGFSGSAASYLLQQLRATGKLDEQKRRVVCEPFSRDIRGAATNSTDLLLCRRMADQCARLSDKGLSHLMPTVQGGVTGSLHFDHIITDNSVDPEDERLGNMLEKLASSKSVE